MENYQEKMQSTIQAKHERNSVSKSEWSPDQLSWQDSLVKLGSAGQAQEEGKKESD